MGQNYHYFLKGLFFFYLYIDDYKYKDLQKKIFLSNTLIIYSAKKNYFKKFKNFVTKLESSSSLFSSFSALSLF
jgi:hypothetical protein